MPSYMPRHATPALITTEWSTAKQDRIRTLARLGYTQNQIARKLSSSNPARYSKNLRQVRRLLAVDQEYLEIQKAVAVGHALQEFPAIMDALVKRGLRGRVDAIKLIMEVTGVHSPRVDHKHSGQVELVVTTVPRPANANRELDEGGVVDAEVVEE